MSTALKNICAFQSGGTPSKANSAYFGGNIPWITTVALNGHSIGAEDAVDWITEEAIKESAAKIVPAGSIMVGTRVGIGKVAINTIPMSTSQDIISLIGIDSDCWDTEFLCRFIQSKSAFLNTQARGATIKGIKIEVLAGLELPDVPLQEQHKIVHVLNTVSDVITARQIQLRILDDLIKARFVEMSKSSITTPTRMGDVATYRNGYAFKPTDWTTEGLPIIRIQNLNDREALYNHYSGTIDSKYQVHTGDILVSWATHLEAYLWQGGDAWLNQHIFRVKFDKMQINKIYYIYSTEDALRQAFKNAHGFKPTMEHIKRSDFEDAIILLPPIEVQNQFATFVTQVDKSKIVVRKALDESRVLYESLMQKYFG